MTIEPDTPFFGLHTAGKLIIPDEDRARDLYDLTRAICAEAGLPAYEVSNHARPGAECRHNLVYWRGHDYAGVGPGAHGRLTIDGRRVATATERRPETWLMRVEDSGTAFTVEEKLTPGEAADEYLLMGLRLVEGIDPARYSALRRSLTRSEADIDTARGRRRGDNGRRSSACDAERLPAARRGGRGSGGLDLRARLERLRRRTQHLTARGRNTQHGQASLIGAVGTEAEYAVDAGKTRGIGQRRLAETLRALRFHKSRDKGNRIVRERCGPDRILPVAGTVAAGKIAKARRSRRRIPGALNRPSRGDSGSSHRPGAEQLHASQIDAVGNQRVHHLGYGIWAIGDEDRCQPD